MWFLLIIGGRNTTESYEIYFVELRSLLITFYNNPSFTNKYMFSDKWYLPMFLMCSYLYSLLKSLCILYSLWNKSNAWSLFVDIYTFCASVRYVLPLYRYNKVCKPQPNIADDRVAIRGERRPLFITLLLNSSHTQPRDYAPNTLL